MTLDLELTDDEPQQPDDPVAPELAKADEIPDGDDLSPQPPEGDQK